MVENLIHQNVTLLNTSPVIRLDAFKDNPCPSFKSLFIALPFHSVICILVSFFIPSIIILFTLKMAIFVKQSPLTKL